MHFDDRPRRWQHHGRLPFAHDARRIVLPLVDGSIFTIFFNKVRRKAAQFSAKKLLEANVPNFGAVLNGLNLAVSGYYYAQYYDKSYKDYYVVMAKDESSPER